LATFLSLVPPPPQYGDTPRVKILMNLQKIIFRV
jgi:hypothetical protein